MREDVGRTRRGVGEREGRRRGRGGERTLLKKSGRNGKPDASCLVKEG